MTMTKLSTITATAALLLLCPSASGFRTPSGSAGRSAASSVVPSQLRAGEVDESDGDTADNAGASLTRRRLLSRALSSAAASSSIWTDRSSPASAKVVSAPSSVVASPPALVIPARDALLRAIADRSPDDAIVKAIEGLIPLSPLKGNVDKASYAVALEGEWRLLWYSTSNFSPLLKLPSPFRPDSYQYFGDAAAREVGEGRVAQGLVGGILSALGPDAELWLSSGAVPAEGSPSTLEIYPPFRFQLGKTFGSASEKRTIVEADSDAEFRRVNARSEQAQLAPKNEYKQLYLENYGRGSLRVSVIASGDPVIVGETFVHQKL